MAEKKPEPAPEGGEAPKKKKGKLILFIIIGVLVVVLAGGGAAFFLLKKKPADDEEGDEAPVKEAKGKKAKKKENAPPPAFYKVDKPFTVKLKAEDQEAYLQLELQLKLLDLHLVDQLKAYDPEIKHKVTLVLLSKKASDLNNAVGVQNLSNEIRETVNEILGSPGKRKAGGAAADEAEADAPVQAVLFTTFIVQ